MILHDIIDIPLKIAFTDQTESDLQTQVQYFITTYYFIDIIQNFFVAILVEDQLVTSRVQIAKSYL
jgi:hypothetical protein